MKKQFYRMKLVPDEEGLIVVTTVYYCIHETDCFYLCVLNPQLDYETAKAYKTKVFRIAKQNSRIAFLTKQAAFENLVYLKKKQLAHCKRNIAFINRFIKDTKQKGLNALELSNSFNDLLVLPETRDLVSEYLVFG